MQRTRPSTSLSLSLAACAVLLSAGQATARVSQDEGQVIAAIERYAAASWRNARIPRGEWEDLNQEVFAELLGDLGRDHLARAIHEKESPERRELNRTVWRVAQRYRRAARRRASAGGSVSDPGLEPVAPPAPDRLEVDESAERVDQAARRWLTGRQRRILGSWAAGAAPGELARDMGLEPSIVSDEKYKALRKLRLALGEPASAQDS